MLQKVTSNVQWLLQLILAFCHNPRLVAVGWEVATGRLIGELKAEAIEERNRFQAI